MNSKMTNPAGSVPRVAMASLKRRWVAYGIDSIMLAIADSLVSGAVSQAFAVLGSSLSQSGSTVDLFGIQIAAVMVLQLAVPALYFAWPYSSGGQTIGKALLGIKVVRVDGSPLAWQTGILRTVGYLPSMLLFGLGFLTAIWDKDKQAWHDKIAGTLVVRASVPRETFVGRANPDMARGQQRSWLWVLGALTLLAFMAFGAFAFVGTSEVTQMGPWPGRDVPAEQVAAVDLTHLGLTRGQIKDARSTDEWAGGSYESGVLVRYTAGETGPLEIVALRYSDTDTAASGFSAVTERAKENCRWSTYTYAMGSGVVRCGFPGGHDRILWRGYWILALAAVDGGQYPAQELVDKVRDAMVAEWQVARESSR